MKATGIVRRIDDLGRVVVPKEIRRTLRIREGDPLDNSLTPEEKFAIAVHSILKRYKETRRKHPLDEAAHGSIENAIETERDILHSVRANADYYIDTSFLSTSQLKEQINSIFLDNPDDSMLIKVMSFGFKYGSPNEADLLFDVRCLPNPFYI